MFYSKENLMSYIRTLLLLLVTSPSLLDAQSGSYDWPSQNLNIHNSRYAELDQINKSNVEQLLEAWTFSWSSGRHHPGHAIGC